MEVPVRLVVERSKRECVILTKWIGLTAVSW